MKLDSLRIDERASIALRALYRRYGYLPYQVNTFEEYDLYMKNRSMLSSEQILTFPGAGGALMALKPDITLSIVKNTKDEDVPVKVCYCESIYRVPKGADGFREIMQTGVECIGLVDEYAMSEVLLLAAKSLESISATYMLDVSDMSIVSAILDAAQLKDEERARVLELIGEKNLHGLNALCEELSLPESAAALLGALVSVYGPMDETLTQYETMALPQECQRGMKSLRVVCDLLEAQGVKNVNLDFSVVNDMNYYNGLVFSGFVAGIPASVLSGGRYDLLMRRMGRKSDAVGFAVYLDQLERLVEEKAAIDVDVLILTDEAMNPLQAAKCAQEVIAGGETVRVQRKGAAQICAGRTIDLTGEGAQA